VALYHRNEWHNDLRIIHARSEGEAIQTKNARFDNTSIPGQGADGAIEQYQRDQNPRYIEPEGFTKKVTTSDIERIESLRPQVSKPEIVKYTPPKINNTYRKEGTSCNTIGSKTYRTDVYVHTGNKPPITLWYLKEGDGKFLPVDPNTFEGEAKELLRKTNINK
jgi:hypothetical protein